MRNKNGISLIALIIIIVVIIIGIIFIIVNNNKSNDLMISIEWGSKPSDEYFDLLRTAFDYKLLGYEEATLSLETFNTLGDDVKKANGKWFKNSNVNFWSQVFYDDDSEMLTLTDGNNIASFISENGSGTVSYSFVDEEQLTAMEFSMPDFKGCKITIK